MCNFNANFFTELNNCKNVGSFIPQVSQKFICPTLLIIKKINYQNFYIETTFITQINWSVSYNTLHLIANQMIQDDVLLIQKEIEHIPTSFKRILRIACKKTITFIPDESFLKDAMILPKVKE